jgi:flagellar biosynthetic protein FliR
MLAFQLAAPMVVALFLVDAGLGILARTAPQFNIFVIGVPLKIVVGLLLLMLLIPSFVSLFSGVFQTLFESVQAMINILAGNPPAGTP